MKVCRNIPDAGAGDMAGYGGTAEAGCGKTAIWRNGGSYAAIGVWQKTNWGSDP